MASTAKPIPDGASVVMPMLVCRDAGAELEFCKAALGAVERLRRPGPDEKVAHALVTIGDAMIMIEGEFPSVGSRAPQTDGSSPVMIFVYVENVDQVVERAKAAGATILVPIKDQFWGRPHRANYGSVWACVDHLNARRRNVGGPKAGAVVEHRLGQELTHFHSSAGAGRPGCAVSAIRPID